jgi:hypothetical protein
VAPIPKRKGGNGMVGGSQRADFTHSEGGGGGGSGYLNNTLLANICASEKPGPLGGDCRK